MSLRITCPSCHTDFPVEAGLIEGDAKRLGALLAGMEPALGRAVLGYLRLFKPVKTSLRLARAVRLVGELLELVEAGSVCRDERAGVRRPATPALWIAGIEQMLTQVDKLELPLANHHYLRAIVFGLADRADAEIERKREQDLRQGRPVVAPAAGTGISPPKPPEDKLRNELSYLRQLVDYEQIDQAEYQRRLAEARARYGGEP